MSTHHRSAIVRRRVVNQNRRGSIDETHYNNLPTEATDYRETEGEPMVSHRELEQQQINSPTTATALLPKLDPADTSPQKQSSLLDVKLPPIKIRGKKKPTTGQVAKETSKYDQNRPTLANSAPDPKMMVQLRWQRIRSIFCRPRSAIEIATQAIFGKLREESRSGQKESNFAESLRTKTVHPNSVIRSLFSAGLLFSFIWNFFFVLY